MLRVIFLRFEIRYHGHRKYLTWTLREKSSGGQRFNIIETFDDERN